MEKYLEMKAFRLTYLEYTRSRADHLLTAMTRHLQMLSTLTDLSTFDPGSSEAAEFYVSLHELMRDLESRAPLTWGAIGVLRHACRNPAARHALIHTYKFTPILTRLLGTKLSLERQLRILELLQQLTYGVKISWQEAHLAYLIKTLTQCILGEEKATVEPSLGVLVNLCYKNLPAVYTLMRSVDHKHFLRSVFKMQNDNVNTRVQVCKLLIILDHISGEIPAEDILNFAGVTFITIGEAFTMRDTFLMRHIIDFFDDVRSHSHSRQVLISYDRFHAGTARLLSLLTDDSEPECVGMLFEFIRSLLSLTLPGLEALYTDIVTAAMRWIRTELACTRALEVIHAVAADAEPGSNTYKNIMEVLGLGVTLLLLILDTGGDGGLIAPSAEARSRLTALTRLLTQMCTEPALRAKLLEVLQPEVIQKVFAPLLSVEPTDANNLLQGEVCRLYVHALDLLSCLAPHCAHWHATYTDTVRHKQVQMVLAVVLLTGDCEARHLVLAVSRSQGFNTAALAESLCQVEPLVMLPRSATTSINVKQQAQSSQDMMPLFSLTQEGRLDSFIGQLQAALKRCDITDVSTSAVMELYEYKLAALGHSERALQASLEAASNHSTHLQHRLAQVTAEASRLHQLLYHNQQCLEEARTERMDADSRLDKATKAFEVASVKNLRELNRREASLTELESSVESLREELTHKSTMLDLQVSQNGELRRQTAEVQDEVRAMKLKLAEQAAIFAETQKNERILVQTIETKEQIISTKDNEIKTSAQVIETLKTEVFHLNVLCKGQETSLSEKESELQGIAKQLDELQRMRDAIFDMAKRKSDQ